VAARLDPLIEEFAALALAEHASTGQMSPE
jgi:hypothetical protein